MQANRYKQENNIGNNNNNGAGEELTKNMQHHVYIIIALSVEQFVRFVGSARGCQRGYNFTVENLIKWSYQEKTFSNYKNGVMFTEIVYLMLIVSTQGVLRELV